MPTNPLNAISKVYLDQIAEKKKDDTYLEPDMKKRQANNEKARKELAKGPQMKNPHFEETQMEGVRDADPEKGTAERKARLEKKRGMKMDDHPQYKTEALDPVGKEDGDVNNDGKKDSTDSYLMKRRKAIGNAMKKKLKESRSLSEVMTDTESERIVKEKKVNNKIKINPKLGEAIEEIGGTLIEAIEIDEMDFIIESVYDELIEEGYTEDDVEEAIENAMEATVTFGSDTKPMKKDGSQVGSRRRFLKRKAGEFLQKTGKKLGMASAKAQVAAYNKGQEVKQAVKDKARQKKQGLKNFIKNKAQKVVDRMSEEVENIEELHKGKHGQTEKQYQDSRSDAGKMVSGDSKMSGAAYSSRSMKGTGPNPAGGSKKPEGQGRMTSGARTDLQFRKVAMKKKAAEMKEDTEVSEGVYGDKTSMRKAAAKERAAEKKAGSKAKSPGRLGPSAGKSYADHEEHSIRAHDKITKKTKPSVVGMTSEEASMTPQELQLQKKKARIDRMIAMKRSQDLSKKKGGDAQPTKVMGEEASDAMKDRRMERGGVDGNVDYRRPPKNTNNTFGKKAPSTQSAIDIVKAQIRAKHGKDALIDTKTKKTGYK